MRLRPFLKTIQFPGLQLTVCCAYASLVRKQYINMLKNGLSFDNKPILSINPSLSPSPPIKKIARRVQGCVMCVDSRSFYLNCCIVLYLSGQKPCSKPFPSCQVYSFASEFPFSPSNLLLTIVFCHFPKLFPRFL